MARADSALATLRQHARPLRGGRDDFDPLLALCRDARCVLLGEASHGTHDFYRVRGEITKRLIRDHGFGAVAIEGDWPDAYRVHRYIHGLPPDRDAAEALAGFQRFPQWIWRNADVLDFVGWLRTHNQASGHPPVGFFGLDLYSLHRSMQAVLAYLASVDPPAAERAAERYACFDHFGEDPQAYGYATTRGLSSSCETAVIRQLEDLRASAATYLQWDGKLAADNQFYAEQNAQVVMTAERYYRAMFARDATAWTLRDRHMAETLEALGRHLRSQGRSDRIVVWAHNSHLGDARATSMSQRGELNLGQLTRVRLGEGAVLVGFTTFDGTVTAASAWDGHVERKVVRPALAGSIEALCHQVGLPAFLRLPRSLGAERRARPSDARTRDRGDLSPRDRADQSLLPRRDSAPVRSAAAL